MWLTNIIDVSCVSVARGDTYLLSFFFFCRNSRSPVAVLTQCTMLEATSGDVVQLLKIMSELHSKVRI